MIKVCKFAVLFLIFVGLLACNNAVDKGLNADDSTKLTVPPMGLNTFYVTQEIDGQLYDREYLMQVPVDFNPDKTYPLVLGFHGGSNVGALWPAVIRHLIEEGEFIGIYPQGFNRRWNSSGSKNGANDVEFLDLLVEQLHGYSNFDIGRMYAIGYSNGSGLVFKYAMETNHFKGVAGLASQLMRGIEPIEGKKPVSTFVINGTHDPVIPIDGGKFRNRELLSAIESAKKFAELFGCDMQPVVREETLGTIYEFNNGKDGVASWFYKIENGDHGLRQHEDPDFYRKIWEFLKNH
jgi:poly(3-hydroxybutyrate) depolymerase